MPVNVYKGDNLMNSKTAVACLASALIGGATVASVSSYAQHEQHTGAAKSTMQSGAKMLHDNSMAAAKKTVEGKMPMANDTDKAFGLMMADHHKMGIKMADIELKHGNDSAMKAMAKKIKAVQQKEAKTLESLAKKAK